MFLKIMGKEELPDDHAYKSFRIIEASDIQFDSEAFAGSNGERGEPGVIVTDPSGQQRLFVLHGNAYVLNNAGKTIDSFAWPAPSRERPPAGT